MNFAVELCEKIDRVLKNGSVRQGLATFQISFTVEFGRFDVAETVRLRGREEKEIGLL